MQFCKPDHVQQIRNQSENDNIPQEPENLRFAPIIYFLIILHFLIDLIDNIITYNSPYSPYYVTRTSANGSAVYWSREFLLYRLTPEILRFHPITPSSFPLQSL